MQSINPNSIYEQDIPITAENTSTKKVSLASLPEDLIRKILLICRVSEPAKDFSRYLLLTKSWTLVARQALVSRLCVGKRSYQHYSNNYLNEHNRELPLDWKRVVSGLCVNRILENRISAVHELYVHLHDTDEIPLFTALLILVGSAVRRLGLKFYPEMEDESCMARVLAIAAEKCPKCISLTLIPSEDTFSRLACL